MIDPRQTTWDSAQRNVSRSIFVRESTNLVDWTSEGLVTVEEATAGMVWAPEAIWDASKSKVSRFMVFFSFFERQALI